MGGQGQDEVKGETHFAAVKRLGEAAGLAEVKPLAGCSVPRVPFLNFPEN